MATEAKADGATPPHSPGSTHSSRYPSLRPTRNPGSPKTPRTPFTPGTTGPAPPDKSMWDALTIENNHQRFIVNYFRDFSTVHPNIDQVQIIDQIRRDLEISSLSDAGIMINYNIYKCIRAFLEGHGIELPARVNGSNMIIARILSTIWPTDDDLIQEALVLYRQFSGIRAPHDPHRMKTRQKITQENLPSSTCRLHEPLTQESLSPTISSQPLPTTTPSANIPVPQHSVEVETKNQQANFTNTTQRMPPQTFPYQPSLQPFPHQRTYQLPPPNFSTHPNLPTYYAPTQPSSYNYTHSNHHLYNPHMYPKPQHSGSHQAPLSQPFTSHPALHAPPTTNTDFYQHNPFPQPYEHPPPPVFNPVQHVDDSKRQFPHNPGTLHHRPSTFSQHPSRRESNSANERSHAPSDNILTKLLTIFKYNDQKFGGTSDEEWNIALEEYVHICDQHGATSRQRAMYLHALLKDEPKRFYFARMKNETNWERMVTVFNERYHGHARARGIWEDAQKLSYQDFLTDDAEPLASYQTMCRKIEKIVPQCPYPHNDDMAMRETLLRAVKTEPWAQNAIGNLATTGFKKEYRVFHDELETALKQYIVFKGDLRKNPATNSKLENTTSTPNSFSKLSSPGASIWYQRQARYGRDRFARKSTYSAGHGQKNGSCYNCGDKNHIAPDCKKPRDECRIVEARMEHLMKGRSDTEKVKILSALMKKQSMHVNFLSEQLANDITPQHDDISYLLPDELENDTSNTITTEPDPPDIGTPDIFHSLVNQQENATTPMVNHFETLHANSFQAHNSNDFTPINSCTQHFEDIVTKQATVLSNTASTSTVVPIHVTELHPTNVHRFDGACLDIGAQRTCIGFKQALAYCQGYGVKLTLQKSPFTFTFGDGVYPSLGTMKIRIPTPDLSFLDLDVDVVKPDVPFLLGLDILDKHHLVADNVENKLRSRTLGWSIPISRRRGHLYIDWRLKEALFTRSELNKLHRHFWHPSSAKLYNLLKRTHPEETNEDTRRTLEEIQKACKTCTIMSPQPHRFRVSFPKGPCVFNEELALDLMWLDKKPVLHVVDTNTHFSAAMFLPGKTTADIWNCFLSCWATVYIGHPDRFRVDQESVFTGKEFAQLTAREGIVLQLSGIQSHNAIGVGERYHAPLRRIYEKVKLEVPNVNQHLALQIAVKAMNDTMGPEGLVPSLLVFGVLPRMPPRKPNLPGHEDRIRALQIARLEMSEIVAKLKVTTALRTRVPPAASYLIKPGEQVYVHNENARRWTGPFTVTRTFEKQVWIDRHDGEKQYSLDHCIPVKQANGMSLLNHINYSLSTFLNNTINNTETSEIFLSEILKSGDPRAYSDECRMAIEKEIKGLEEKGVWRVVNRSDIPRDANILGGRFVLSIKNKGSHYEMYKARFVALGHKDREKHLLVHDSTNLRQRSIRIITCIAAIFGFAIWTQDVSQAYLQSSQNLQREIYIRPPKQFKLSKEELLRLIKPLYGITEAGDYWDATMTDFQKNDMQMSQATLDISLFFKVQDGILQGVSGYFVDDGIHAGNELFQKENEKIEQRFISKPREFDDFKFAGIHITRTPQGISLQQVDYTKTIKPLPKDASFSDYRSLRQKLMWASHTRPDILCAVNKTTQVTEKSFNSIAIKRGNSIVSYLHRHPDRGIFQRKLDYDTLYLRVYADSSFADNDDSTTQLGYILLICDAFNHCNVYTIVLRRVEG